MKKEPKELLKEYVESQNFTSTADIMEGMKELFKDVLHSKRQKRRILPQNHREI